MQQYWTTKQTVLKKLGKKEDDCIISSDLELDLKLELYQTIEESFLTLMRILEVYQEKLCGLSEEENALGRFLKESGKHDKTRAGKVMTSTGKALSYSAQQRLTLRIPLVRLYQEVETFQYRAIVDTLNTVEKMEKARTAYRGSLMWMKDISQQLDPDTFKQMEKFRKVQIQVRKAKQKFDKMKLDTLQKVDLLSFSRCNLFSQTLAAYQNSLLNVSKKIAQSSTSVTSITKGYQHFEFSMLKELTETSKKLAESNLEGTLHEDKDTILFFEAEYHDEFDSSDPSKNTPIQIERTMEISEQNSSIQKEKNSLCRMYGENLLNANEVQTSNELVFWDELPESPVKDETLFNDENISDWQKMFGTTRALSSNKTPNSREDSSLHFLPSQLLTTMSSLKGEIDEGDTHSASNPLSAKPYFSANEFESNKDKENPGISAWFHLFADLDPLANPDLIGEKKGNIEDRSC